MGIQPKIGITGLPRSGKSAVLDKVVSMIIDERKADSRARRRGVAANIIGGMRTEAIIENGERVGYACVDILSGDRGVMAHREIDSRNRILGFGIDPSELDKVAVLPSRTPLVTVRYSSSTRSASSPSRVRVSWRL